MPLIDPARVPARTGSKYPEPYARQIGDRATRALGAAAGLTQFGVNLVTLGPGAMASQRHWHEKEDEFLIVTEGELTLVDDTGETAMRPGDCAAFPAGKANGHHMVNRSDAPGSFVVVGSRIAGEVAWYSDIDMVARFEGRDIRFTRKDGGPIDTGG